MTTPTSQRAESDKCGLCNQTRQWHEDHKPQHLFIEEGEEAQIRRPERPPAENKSSSTKSSSTKSSLSNPSNESLSNPSNLSNLSDEEEALRDKINSEPGRIQHYPEPPRIFPAPDLVLRFALVDAGVITPEQLSAAETKLMAIQGGGSVFAQYPALISTEPDVQPHPSQ